jgi:hypothetical protein
MEFVCSFYIGKELELFSMDSRITSGQDSLDMWNGWKKDECRGRLFSISAKEEGTLVDHAEDGIHKSRNRPSA